MRPVLLTWRGRALHSYPVLLYVGLVLGIAAGEAAGRADGLDAARVWMAMIVLTIPALVGSRILFLATEELPAGARRLDVWRPSGGGAALYGGLVAATVVSVPLLALVDVPLAGFWDAATITLLTGMVCTRVGCLLNGCCAGRATASRFGVSLPEPDGQRRRRIPTQLLEAGFAAVLLAAAAALRNQRPFPGALFLFAVAAYGLARLGLDTLRDRPGDDAGSSVPQRLSATAAALALTALTALWLSDAGGA